MKILYAIQGTGNGHLSRAVDIVPCLQQHGEVDLLISGTQGDLKLPFPVKYEVRGLSFIFGKSGGVDLWKTFAKANTRRLVKNIRKLPVQEYDLVISDFEPVSSWACYFRGKPCIALSHQAAVQAPGYPAAENVDRMGRLILSQYAPADYAYGFHFFPNDTNINTPVIRQQVRRHAITDAGHYTVYLPAYDDRKLLKRLAEFPEVVWDVFSKHNKKKMKRGNITIQPINGEAFTSSMASSTGVLCGAGFETPAEALFLGKKLLVIPMKNQYEQQLNAAALKSMGVPVVKSLKAEYAETIKAWLKNGERIPVDYPDHTQAIVDRIVKRHYVPKEELK
ncbi:MAG: glycosyl transferase [Flavobacterium sp. BFFFF1]|uniref:glycosyltransferase family protein n=1 Tax=Flavobacterium sp. BFFFF1 TaxID=2015557 RepID=UPI000BD048C5|nr:glycosyltransferase family protein [Flavobacterium sp. BFFFF1]OYU79264.1 MAG: glycosyl transferase [Flavobacterium sp. BFFFF1]